MEPFIPDLLLDPQGKRIDYAAPALIAALGAANREIAHYNALLTQSPCAHLLLGSLVRREAMMSSRIEGSQSTLGEVLRFEEDEGVAGSGEQRDDLNEIRNYASALNFAAAELEDRSFSLHLLKSMHAMLLGSGSVRGQKKNPGAFRTKQVWIGAQGADIEQATYLPPESIRLAELMEDWAAHYHADAPDALVQAAILHAQFELIHPFEDGNGRLGRLLIPLFLCEKNVLDRPNFYPSAYLDRHRDAYVGALRRLNAKPGDWDGWVLFFLRAVAAQARATSVKVDAISALYEALKIRFVALTRSQFAVPLLDAIFAQPIFRQARIKEDLAHVAMTPSNPTLHNLLNRLVKEGVLSVLQKGSGRRGSLYELTELVALLEDESDLE